MVISMSKSTILVVILVGTLAAAQPPTTPEYFLETCRGSMGNYTKSSHYETNLRTVLSNLAGNSSKAHFFNASAGNEVFGQYYCRGDINTTLCHDCINEAVHKISVKCSSFKSAVVWYDVCTLRYDKESMVGVEAERPAIYGWSSASVTDPETFGPLASETITGLINEAASFATGERVVSGVGTMYCLVQCSPDLNQTECHKCLNSTSNFIPDRWPQQMLVFFPSCQLRYSTNGTFYPLPNEPPTKAPVPSPALTASPPPVNTSSPTAGDSTMLRSRESLRIGVVISAVVFALLRYG